MVEKARFIGLFLCPNVEKSSFKTVDIFGWFFECNRIRTDAEPKTERFQGKWKSECLFHKQNNIQTLQDRFVWYHENRDTAQSGLFCFWKVKWKKQKISLKYIIWRQNMKKLHFNSTLNHKTTDYDLYEICVEKVVTLYGRSFEELKNHLMHDDP